MTHNWGEWKEKAKEAGNFSDTVVLPADEVGYQAVSKLAVAKSTTKGERIAILMKVVGGPYNDGEFWASLRLPDEKSDNAAAQGAFFIKAVESFGIKLEGEMSAEEIAKLIKESNTVVTVITEEPYVYNNKENTSVKYINPGRDGVVVESASSEGAVEDVEEFPFV